MKNRQVVCESPTIIRNPLLPELLNTYRDYMANGVRKRWCGHYTSFNFPYVQFSVNFLGVTPENIDEFYLIDYKTGETIPMFNLVPCGHCAACESNKQMAFVHRCELETQCYVSKPWFVTLTYDNDHLPTTLIDNIEYPQLKVRDVQLFLKRFRVNLERKGVQDSSHPIRYVVCGEYGKKRRPHYHMIIWNIQAFEPIAYNKVFNILEDSWQNGFCSYRVIDTSSSTNTFRYTTKYMHKHQYLPYSSSIYYRTEFKHPFQCSSNRHGGIGAKWIDIHKDNIMCKGAKYLDLFNARVKDLFFNSYIINRLVPSYSRLVPSKYRNACRELAFYDYDGTYSDILDDLRKENPCYIPKKIPIHIKEPHYFSAEECYREILRWRNHANYVNPDEARKMQYDRESFLLYVMSDIPEKDVKNYVYKSKQMLSRQRACEYL